MWAKQTHSVAQSNSAFTRAVSLAQLVLALGPSPRPWTECDRSTVFPFLAELIEDCSDEVVCATAENDKFINAYSSLIIQTALPN